MNKQIRHIADNGVLIAAYIALTFIAQPISYGPIQFRIAEILILLCFFRKDFIVGLTIGTMIANIASFNPIDIVFGGLATFLSCLVIIFSKHLLISAFAPVLLNGLIIGLELFLVLHEPFWLSFLTVSLGELAVIMFGYILIRILSKRKFFFEFLRADQNTNYKF